MSGDAKERLWSPVIVNGVLSVDMPKRAEAKAKQIKVNVPKTLKAA